MGSAAAGAWRLTKPLVIYACYDLKSLSGKVVGYGGKLGTAYAGASDVPDSTLSLGDLE